LEIRVKKLFNGCVSIRDYKVNQALKNKEGINIKLDNEEMFIPYSQLLEGKKSNLAIRSRWGDNVYDLIDYKFIPNQGKLI